MASPPPPAPAPVYLVDDPTKPKKKEKPDVWQKLGKWDMFNRLLAVGRSSLPTYTHGISVAVVGGPDSDIRRAWYLAVSAAFGRRLQAPMTFGQTSSMEAEWDITGKTVKIELFTEMSTGGAYESWLESPLGSAITTGIGGGFALFGAITFNPAFVAGGAAIMGIGITAGAEGAKKTHSAGTPLGAFHRGPEQLTVGSGWAPFARLGVSKSDSSLEARWNQPPCAGVIPKVSVAKTLLRVKSRPGIFREFPLGTPGDFSTYPYRVMVGADGKGGASPGTAAIGGCVALPDDGRVITTAHKTDPLVQCPVPSVDGVARSHSLAMTVRAALQSPCYLPPRPPCGYTKHAGSNGGVYLNNYTPGDNKPFLPAAAAILATRPSTTASISAPLPVETDFGE